MRSSPTAGAAARPAGRACSSASCAPRASPTKAIVAGRGLIEEREGAADEFEVARKLVLQVSARYAARAARAQPADVRAARAPGFDGDTIRRVLSIRDDGRAVTSRSGVTRPRTPHFSDGFEHVFRTRPQRARQPARRFHQAMENSITACPPNVWGDRIGPHEFWYLVYHTAFWLDCYPRPRPSPYVPPAPHTTGRWTPPASTRTACTRRTRCSRSRAQPYPRPSRTPRAHARVGGGTLALLQLRPQPLRGVLNTNRHVQHHVGQLQLLLRQGWRPAPRWVRTMPLPGDHS